MKSTLFVSFALLVISTNSPASSECASLPATLPCYVSATSVYQTPNGSSVASTVDHDYPIQQRPGEGADCAYRADAPLDLGNGERLALRLALDSDGAMWYRAELFRPTTDGKRRLVVSGETRGRRNAWNFTNVRLRLENPAEMQKAIDAGLDLDEWILRQKDFPRVATTAHVSVACNHHPH